MQDQSPENNQEQDLSLREQIENYLRHWPWFVLSILIMLIGAFVYLRYATPSYKATATILIKDSKNNSLSELSAFADLGAMGGFGGSEFDNELEILRSKTIMERVVDELHLAVTYYKEGNIRVAELYANRPFNVNVISEEDSTPRKEDLYIQPISLTQFKMRESGGNATTHDFGDVLTTAWGQILVSPNVAMLKQQENYEELKISYRNPKAVASSLRSRVQVSQVSKNSSVIQLELVGPSMEKNQAILNEMIRQYNEDAINDRNMVSRNTADFIQSRLVIITSELDSVETGKVEFKEENRLTDIEAEGQIFLENASEFNKRQIEVETQIQLAKTIEDYLINADKSNLLPANLMVEKEGLSGQIDIYNKVVMERNRLLQSSTDKNPMVVDLDRQITGLRANVMQSLQNVKSSLQITSQRLKNQEAKIGGEIRGIPSKEKEFRSIIRQQEIKETLYLYLLQKREETAISLAVTTPKAKIVDSAYSNDIPVSPKKQIIMLAAFILGLLLPFSIIYLGQLLDNKVRDRIYVERHSDGIPVIGELPKIGKKEAELVTENDHSVLAESFRILRTNLQYLLLNKQQKTGNGKKIFITSTVKGEGKTFVSSNLAITLANSGAKVVLVGADIRNPQIQRYIDGEFTNHGVVEYLFHKDSSVDDYIQQSKSIKNLSLLVSGTIPPNPAELWMQSRAGDLFNDLAERFDYVVVDTAPAMMVTDTLLINQYADVTLYTIRAGYTEKRLLGFPIESKKAKKLSNVAFVLNDVSYSNFGYGNKYGYSYGAEEKTFWQRLFFR